MKNDTLYLKKDPTATFKISQHKRAFAGALLAVLIAYLLFTGAALWLPSVSLPTTLPLVFLLAGVVHVRLLKKQFRQLSTSQEWLFSSAVAATALLLLSSSLIWGLQLSFRNMLAGAGAFMLPFVLTELWIVYAGISYASVIPWRAPAETDNEFPSIYLNGIPVRFKVLQEPESGTAGAVSFLASGKMTVGEAFKDMVQKQAKKNLHTIALRNEENKPYTWIFYTSDLLIWTQVLNPDKSLPANGVRRNAIIYAQRVSEEAFIIPSQSEQTIEQS